MTRAVFLTGLLALAASALPLRAHAVQRPPSQQDAAAILAGIEKLGVVASVLYVGAHPDDENTRLIAWLSNGRRARTGYLSLTRGDGGQNLIGAELGDALGVLRTQELLEARRIDGGEQFFTRAVDFGYSKSAEESFAKWGRDEILADVVRVVRTFRPDVIVTRFATDGSGGHGHHTASALLAQEAFELAADPKAFPEQLAQGLEAWQAKRLFFNGSTWWKSDLADVAKKDPGHWLDVDVGGFDALLGASYTEIAGRSRSQHKSQGFGAAETRGALSEYLRLDQGAPYAARDPFDGVDTHWTRFPGGERIDALVKELVGSYDVRAPEHSLPKLAGLARALDELAASSREARTWASVQAGRARELALQVCGAVLEVTAGAPSVAAGDSIEVTLSAVQRRPGSLLQLVRVTPRGGDAVAVGEPLNENRPLTRKLAYAPPATSAADEPYWLARPHAARYEPADGYTGIEPASRAAARFRFTLGLEGGREIEVERELVRKWVDRVAGERVRPVVVTPPVSIEVADPVALVRGDAARVSATIVALGDGVGGELRVRAPEGWTLAKAPPAIEGLRRGERRELELELRRGGTAHGGTLGLSFVGPRGATDRTMHAIDHAHVLPQTWYSAAEIELVPIDLAVDVHTVGYLEGAGDDVPQALKRLGVEVERLDPASATAADLDRCDAIVTGIRAYNTVKELARLQPQLLAYVERGGTLVVQYNTNGDDLVLDAKKIGPHPFSISRTRVTVEEAPATFVDPSHALLTTPNRLTAADFEGWVQERGLYFAGDVDARYAAPLAWSDPGEPASTGALITCELGRGRFTYTGISLFRQLPAGVPGAYRLLANLIARRSSPSERSRER